MLAHVEFPSTLSSSMYSQSIAEASIGPLHPLSNVQSAEFFNCPRALTGDFRRKPREGNMVKDADRRFDGGIEELMFMRLE